MKIWRDIQLFHESDLFFNEIIKVISAAQKSISLEFYIFELNEITELLLSELALASARGCRVRLLVDGVGSVFSLDSVRRRCKLEGIEFRVYHPLPTFFQWLARLPSVLLRRAPTLLRRANRRNHRKVVIVDERVAFLGSVNMSRVHFEKVMGKFAWRDSSVRVEGLPLESLNAAFELAWQRSKSLSLLKTEPDALREKLDLILKWQTHVRLNVNEKIRRQLYKDLRRRILMAEDHVYIVTAYFLPKRAVVRALSKAAQRGVDIRIIIPGPSDVPIVKWIADQVTAKLLKNGVHLFEYQPRILHAKYMIIDNWASVGSFNLNHRSLLHDLEVEAVLTDSESLQNLNHQFLEDLRQSEPLDILSYQQTPFWKRWIAKVLFKLRYWF